MQDITSKAINFLKKNSIFDIAHDIDHTIRVLNLSMYLLKKSKIKIKLKLIVLFALFHDYLDYKLVSSDNFTYKKRKLLLFFTKEIKLNKDETTLLIHLIINEWINNLWDIENEIIYKIVKDADIIDSLWSIWIARVFSYWWKINRNIFEEKKSKNKNSTIHYIKNNLTKKYQKLNFDISKKIAKPKLDYINKFVNDLEDEILFYDKLN